MPRAPRWAWLVGGGCVLAAAGVAGLLLSPRPSAPPVPPPRYQFDSFKVADDSPNVVGTIVGPDHNLWMVNIRPRPASSLVRASLDGTMTAFPVPAGQVPVAMAAGPDGNLWFTVGNSGGGLGRLTPSGGMTEYAFPPEAKGAGALAFDRSGGLWVAGDGAIVKYGGQFVVRYNTAGVPTLSAKTPNEYWPGSPMVLGPGGNLWLPESMSDIVRISPTGAVTVFGTNGLEIVAIASGPDGNLWVGTRSTIIHGPNDSIARIGMNGRMTSVHTFARPLPFITSIAAGRDGNMWFTENSANKIGFITMSGKVTEVPLPKSFVGPTSIIQGPDGNMWFTCTVWRVDPATKLNHQDGYLVRLRRE